MNLTAGAAEADITPPLGVHLCGFAYRPNPCTSIYDRLKARALVLSDGVTHLAIVAADLIGLDFDLVRLIRRRVRAESAIPSLALMLSCTHTHGGPVTRQFNAMGPRDPAYIAFLVATMAHLVRRACSNVWPATISAGRAPLQLGVNRREIRTNGDCVIGHNPAGPVDQSVRVVTLRDGAGRLRIVLFSHTCHPTTLGGDNLAVTADFCGAACERIRAETNGTVVPFFLQGCCADINPFPRGEFAHSQTAGESLAAAVLAAAETAEPLAGHNALSAETSVVSLPTVPMGRAQAEVELAHWSKVRRSAEGKAEAQHADGMLRYYRMERAAKAAPVQFEIQRLGLGGADLVGFPAEMFVSYGNELSTLTPRPCLALGCVNGVHGYVPTAAAFEKGGYEVDIAHRYYHAHRLTPECEKIIRRATSELLGLDHRTPTSLPD